LVSLLPATATVVGATKWDKLWQYQSRDGAFHHQSGGAALVLSVTPAKILAFSTGTFSQTRHRF